MKTLSTANKQILNRLGHNLRILRLAKGFTQEELANKAGLERSHISRIENNHKSKKPYNPTFSYVADLASALGVTFEKLIQD